MTEVQEHIRAAIESLESLRDTRVSEIVKKLKSAENDIENLMKSEAPRSLRSLKEVSVIGGWGLHTVVGTTDPYYKKYTPWEHRVPDTVTPDYRDQWRYTGKIPEGL